MKNVNLFQNPICRSNIKRYENIKQPKRDELLKKLTNKSKKINSTRRELNIKLAEYEIESFIERYPKENYQRVNRLYPTLNGWIPIVLDRNFSVIDEFGKQHFKMTPPKNGRKIFLAC